MTRVDVLHLDGCPNVEPTAARVRAIAADLLGVSIDLHFVRVGSIEDAVRERFLGSPTVRVNGTDIEPASWGRSDFGLSCRVYDGSGIPPNALIIGALKGKDQR